MKRVRRYVNQARSFARSYTAGLNVRDVSRLIGEDASHAYRVLSRDQDDTAAGRNRVGRFLQHCRILFVGISKKLSPARRLVFLLAVIATLLGILGGKSLEIGGSGFEVSVGTSTFYLMTGLAGFAFLFVLELVDRIRVRDELEVARELQADLLPDSAPNVPGYSFAHSYRTANEVGGDYYDFSSLPDGRVAIILGDASGHGIAAGLLMAISNATLKTALEVDPRPNQVAQLLNSTLYRTGDRRAFMTFFYALLEPATGILEYVCAGHPFPMVVTRSGDVLELGEGALPLGMRAEVDLPVGSFQLSPGESMLLFTDGLPEAMSSSEESFGFSRLRTLLTPEDRAQDLHDRVLTAFQEHIGGADLPDDVTLLAVARAASS